MGRVLENRAAQIPSYQDAIDADMAAAYLFVNPTDNNTNTAFFGAQERETASARFGDRNPPVLLGRGEALGLFFYRTICSGARDASAYVMTERQTFPPRCADALATNAPHRQIRRKTEVALVSVAPTRFAD